MTEPPTTVTTNEITTIAAEVLTTVTTNIAATTSANKITTLTPGTTANPAATLSPVSDRLLTHVGMISRVKFGKINI